MTYVVVYNKFTNSIHLLPDYMVSSLRGKVHVSNNFAIWRARPDLIILGDL